MGVIRYMRPEILKKKWILPACVAFAILALVLIVKLQPPMSHQQEAGYVTPVNVIAVEQYPIAPTIVGYGVVEPDILFEAKSEISGKVVYVHPQLRDGAVLPKETVVIRIEPDDYQLSLQQAEADVAASEAKIREINVQIRNYQGDLKLAQGKLALMQKDLKRTESLLEKNLVSQSSVEAQQINVLQLKQEVQNLQSQLRTLPEQKGSLEAQLANTQAAEKGRQRDLDKAMISLPFNARISELAVEESQYVGQGTLLFGAQTTDKILINAQFPLQEFRTLAKGFKENQAQIIAAFRSGFSNDLFNLLGLTAKVTLADNDTQQWDAKVERISSTLDPATRTLGVVVSVDKPYEQILPGVRPPLMDGMYTKVSLQGKIRPFYAVPRDALHEDQLFLADDDKQLVRRAMPEAQLQGNLALYESGLQQGEWLIVSDVFPAIPGMLLKPIVDTELQTQVKAWAKAE